MRFLITGGAGFIGAALANQLLTNNHEVRVIDDLSNGDQSRLLPEIMFFRGDVIDVPRLWSMLQDIDCVYHLAARVSVAESIKYPSDYNLTNVGGTVSLMEAVRDADVGRVILASSAAVYGTQSGPTVSESLTPKPETPYAVSKLAAEQYVHTIGELYDIETVAVRIFNAYGTGQTLPISHAPVVPRFLQQVLGGGSVVLHGKGDQVRDFVYVTDVVDALVNAATVNAVDRPVLNLGSGTGTSIEQLVNLIEEAVGKKVNRLYNPNKRGGVDQLVANLDQAHAMLNYKPQIGLEAGIQRILREDNRFLSS